MTGRHASRPFGSYTLAAMAVITAVLCVQTASDVERHAAGAQTAELSDEIVFTLGAFNRDLYTVEVSLDGAPIGRRLTDTAGVSEGAPDWSPDAWRVAYTAGRDDGPVEARSAIWVLDTRTSENVALSFGPDDDSPDWSPDGRLIAFTHSLERGRALQSSSISVVDPADPAPGPILAPLQDETAILQTPKWSPDGRRLAFVVATEHGGDLYAVDADGTGAGRLLEHDGWDDIEPAWSPDGRLIAFASGFHREPGATRPNPRHGIWLLDVQTGTFGVWLADPSLDLRHPAWSPEGDRLVFEARPISGGEISLRIAPLTAGAAMPAPFVAGAEPDWSRVPVPVSPTPIASPTRTVEAPPTATFPASATPPGLPGETPFATLPPFPTLPPPGPTQYPPAAPTFPLHTATPAPGTETTPTTTPSATPSTDPGTWTIHLPLAGTGKVSTTDPPAR